MSMDVVDVTQELIKSPSQFSITPLSAVTL